jgi:hypothetical protein
MSRNPNEYHLVTFDPGGTIGWAHFTVDCRAFSRPEHKVLKYLSTWDCGEFEGSEFEQCQEAKRLIWRAKFGDMPYNTTTDVVSLGLTKADFLSEDFELMQTIGGHALLSPVRINAVLSDACETWGMHLTLQRRALRTSVTPERLVMYGFKSPMGRRWTKTSKGKDAFAAMQHGIVWLRRVKEISRGRPWKLSEGGTHNAYWDCNCADGGRCDLKHPR